MKRARYIGNDSRLKDEIAYIQYEDRWVVKAQFNNTSLREAFGWWPFIKEDFIDDQGSTD